MARVPTIHGRVAAGFEPVRAAFAENFRRRGELGAAVNIWHRGEVVVDLWAGIADRDTGQPWAEDTASVIFSCTKGMAALALLMLNDRGLLDYEAPVAEYWPEFAHGGKDGITVRTLLNHRSGLVGLDVPLSIDDFENNPEKVADACASQIPHWEPGTRQGYHATSFGILAAELFRRVADTSIGRFFDAEVARPLGADVHIGLPPARDPHLAPVYPADIREKLTRVLPKLLLHRGTEGRVYRQAIQKTSFTRKALQNPAELGARGLHNFNSARVRRLELPWANGVASARGLARVYQALVAGGQLDGVRLAAAESIAPVHERQSWSKRDEVLRKPMGFSQGFVKEELHLFSPHPTMFGHPGAGGSLGMADPTAEVAMGYVMNRMGHHVRSPRALALCHALYRSLGLR